MSEYDFAFLSAMVLTFVVAPVIAIAARIIGDKLNA